MSTAVLTREVPDHVRALVTRLSQEYGEQVPAETVAEVVQSCYTPLAQARITAYVPTLVEKSSRDRLRRLGSSRADLRS